MLAPSCALIAAKAALGEWADLRSFDEKHRIVEARFIRQLLLQLPIAKSVHESIAQQQQEYSLLVPPHDLAPVPVAPVGIRIRGAIIEGILDLSDGCGTGATVLPTLALEDCSLPGERSSPTSIDDPDYLLALDLSRARIARLSLRKSRFGQVRAREALIEGGVDLSGVEPLDGCVHRSWPGVDMAAFRKTLQAGVADPQGEQSLRPSVSDTTENSGETTGRPPPDHACCWVNLSGSQVGGDISVIDAKLRTPPPRSESSYHGSDARYSLHLDRAIVGGSLSAYGVSVFDGGIQLHLARIQGVLWLGGAQLIRQEGSALDAQGAEVGGVFATARPLSAYGGLYFDNARIASHFDLKGASLDGAGDTALFAERATIGGDMSLHAGFAARGSIRVRGVSIGGALEMKDALLDGRGGDALDGSSLNIGGGASLTNVIAKDCIWLYGARIGGTLDFNGAKLSWTEPREGGRKSHALSGTDIEVGESVLMGRGFTATGTVRFQRARISKDFGIVNATILAADAVALDIGWATVDGNLILERNRFEGLVRLKHACANILCDDNSGYTGAQNLDLDGFRYEILNEDDLSADENNPSGCTKSRIAWLQRMKEYEPQPYVNLARVLANQGLTEDARNIMIEKHNQDLERLWTKIGAGGKLLAVFRTLIYCASLLFGWMFGYGLNPARALATIVVSFVVGWSVFALANDRGAMVVDQQAIAGTVVHGTHMHMGAAVSSESENVADRVPCAESIRPSLYALDVFIPLVDLRQESKCEINVAAGADRLFPGFSAFGGSIWGSEVELYRYFKALYAFSGWLIISLAILTFSGVLERRFGH